MSKNVYYIDDSSSSTHLATLKNLLEEIATEYFYSYTLADDNSALDCFVNTGTVEQPNLFGLLRFEMVSGKISAIRYGANGVSKSDSSYSTPAYYIQRITKTDYGIAFKLVAGTTLTFRDGLYITKSNNGETAVCATSYLHTSSNTANIFASTRNSYEITNVFVENYETSLPLTTLAPIVTSGTADYCPNLFITPQTQYKGTECEFELNGEKYWYNGAIALKE